MSKYGYMVKFNGKYYAAGEEVPDDIQASKAEAEKKEQKNLEPVEVKPEEKKASVASNNPAKQTAQATQNPLRK